MERRPNHARAPVVLAALDTSLAANDDRRLQLDEECRLVASQPANPEATRHGVAAVVHGHDHLFAAEERDGVLYLALGFPTLAASSSEMDALWAGDASSLYAGATLVDGPAYGRITVNASAARVDVVGVETGDVLYTHALR